MGQPQLQWYLNIFLRQTEYKFTVNFHKTKFHLTKQNEIRFS